MPRRRLSRRSGVIIALAAAPAVLFLAAAALVGSGLSDDAGPADAAIVPGNAVEPDGRPSAK